MKNFRHEKARGAAFTLIELLTVIAIIGILAAILIPVVGRVRDSARAAVCSSNIRQSGMGLLILSESDGGEIRARKDGDGGGGLWPERLEEAGVISDREVVFCPTGRHGLADIYNPTAGGSPAGGGDDAWAFRAGYGLMMIENDQVMRPPGATRAVRGGFGQPTLNMWILNTEHVDAPSQYPLMADSLQASSGNTRMRIDSLTASNNAVSLRHSRRANVFFLDGHVEAADSDRMGQLGFQSGFGETRTEVITFNTSLFNP